MENELRQRRSLKGENSSVYNGTSEKVHSKGNFNQLSNLTKAIIFYKIIFVYMLKFLPNTIL